MTNFTQSNGDSMTEEEFADAMETASHFGDAIGYALMGDGLDKRAQSSVERCGERQKNSRPGKV